MSHLVEFVLQLLGCIPGNGDSFPKNSEMGRIGRFFGWFWAVFLVLITLAFLAKALLLGIS